MIKYQGEDIYFSIEIENPDGSIGDLSVFSDLIVFLSTKCHIAKYSMNPKSGYLSLKKHDNILSGVIKSEDTKLMHGELTIEVLCQLIDAEGVVEDNIKSMITGISIEKSNLKQESK